MNRKDETGAGGLVGMQLPIGIEKRKKKVEELVILNPGIRMEEAMIYMSRLTPEAASLVERKLDALEYSDIAEDIRGYFAEVLREQIKKKVKEVVRKKPGGGGYILYGPNPGKKGEPKVAGDFPTKLAAKKAELERYPPKDTRTLKKKRKEIDKLIKDPKKRSEKEAAWAKADAEKKPKKEGLDLIRSIVIEGLFREEAPPNEWDERLAKLSKQSLKGDKKFQNIQKKIEKATQKVLDDAFTNISKALRKDFKTKSFGIKKDDRKDKTYLAFSIITDDANIEPVYIYSESGVPKVELSDNAKVALTKINVDDAKLIRAEIVTVQEQILDKSEDLVKAISARDKYFSSLEDDVDSKITEMSPLEISMLKNLLVRKYKKL